MNLKIGSCGQTDKIVFGNKFKIHKCKENEESIKKLTPEARAEIKEVADALEKSSYKRDIVIPVRKDLRGIVLAPIPIIVNPDDCSENKVIGSKGPYKAERIGGADLMISYRNNLMINNGIGSDLHENIIADKSIKLNFGTEKEAEEYMQRINDSRPKQGAPAIKQSFEVLKAMEASDTFNSMRAEYEKKASEETKSLLNIYGV